MLHSNSSSRDVCTKQYHTMELYVNQPKYVNSCKIGGQKWTAYI